jgi:hypothetical protein
LKQILFPSSGQGQRSRRSDADMMTLDHLGTRA